MAKWKVNKGTQVAYGGVLYGPGDTFEAEDGEVAAEGFATYVSKVRAQPAVDTKAQQSSANKAQQSSANK